VFVDECHRTQGGNMNTQMKRWLAHAIFIGFTETPLLRKDKQMTRDVFGTYIHTYKFHEAVTDDVILDLKYEARDVPQRISSRAAIDSWFEQTTKAYEDEAKRRFIEEPANMKLLIVVSKLLTGFDAPSCTYIYLDNELHDHNLFQAICRTNRLDGDDKDYGYIVDFKELFKDVQEAIAVYSSDELDI